MLKAKAKNVGDILYAAKAENVEAMKDKGYKKATSGDVVGKCSLENRGLVLMVKKEKKVKEVVETPEDNDGGAE